MPCFQWDWLRHPALSLSISLYPTLTYTPLLFLSLPLSAFQNRELKLAFQQDGVDYKILLKVTESTLGVPRARVERSVHYFTVYCPHVVHNHTGRLDLDIVNIEKNGANLTTSLWRPTGVKSTAADTVPALFSPFAGDIDSVLFVARGQVRAGTRLSFHFLCSRLAKSSLFTDKLTHSVHMRACVHFL